MAEKLKTLFFAYFIILPLFLLLISCDDDSSPSQVIDEEIIDDPDGEITEPVDSSNLSETFQEAVDELNAIIHPISGSDPNLDNAELSPLDYLRDMQFVGLGEATHGTKEFFQMKHRIFKYLVENHGFKVFGFEADMGESIYLNRIINGAPGNIKDEMSDKMHFWTWHTEEVKELLEWMAQYNSGLADNEKIQYIGLDCQYFTYQPKLLKEYVTKYAPSILSKTSEILSDFEELAVLSYPQKLNYMNNLSFELFDNFRKRTETLENVLESVKNDLVNSSSKFEYKTHKRLIVNLRQALESIYSKTGRLGYISIRDKYMAENSEWIQELYDGNVKTALWAHSIHLAADPNYGDGGSMGYRLKEKFGDQYQMIAFSFNKGFFYAFGTRYRSGYATHEITSDPDEYTINYLLHYANENDFILREADISNSSALETWLSTVIPLMIIGAVYNGVTSYYYNDIHFKNYYDVMIHFETTNYAEQLSRSSLGKSPEFLY